MTQTSVGREVATYDLDKGKYPTDSMGSADAGSRTSEALWK
jgi:hypothetical protein